MPTITIEGFGTYEAEQGQRLVLAIEQAGMDIGHRCGGHARCTTCRVHVEAGEPTTMTRAEYDKLKERGHLGEFRLSCQIVVENDMTVTPLMRVSDMGWADPGPTPETSVTPLAVWESKEALDQ